MVKPWIWWVPVTKADSKVGVILRCETQNCKVPAVNPAGGWFRTKHFSFQIYTAWNTILLLRLESRSLNLKFAFLLQVFTEPCSRLRRWKFLFSNFTKYLRPVQWFKGNVSSKIHTLQFIFCCRFKQLCHVRCAFEHKNKWWKPNKMFCWGKKITKSLASRNAENLQCP